MLFLLFVLALLAGKCQPNQTQPGDASRQNPSDQIVAGSGNVCKRGFLIGDIGAFIRQVGSGSLLIGDVGAFVRQIRGRGILIGNIRLVAVVSVSAAAVSAVRSRVGGACAAPVPLPGRRSPRGAE